MHDEAVVVFLEHKTTIIVFLLYIYFFIYLNKMF